MTIVSMPSGRSAAALSRSVWSVSATVTLAAITHAYDFGGAAFVVGAAVLVMLVALSSRYRRTGSRVAVALYLGLSLWVVGGFGVVGGVWNHAVKVAVVAAGGGVLPAALNPLFMSPDVGNATYEISWILLGGAAVLAAWLGYRFVRSVRWIAPAGDASAQGDEVAT